MGEWRSHAIARILDGLGVPVASKRYVKSRGLRLASQLLMFAGRLRGVRELVERVGLLLAIAILLRGGTRSAHGRPWETVIDELEANMVTMNKPAAGDTNWYSAITDNWTALEDQLGWTLIETIVANNDATINFTSGIDSTYKGYVVLLEAVIPDTDSVFLDQRVSTDGGSTWKQGASDYNWGVVGGGVGGVGGSGTAGDSKMRLTRLAQGGAAGESLCGSAFMSDPANGSSFPLFRGVLNSMRADAGRPETSDMAGQYTTATAINGIRFYFSSGLVKSGNFKLYGLR